MADYLPPDETTKPTAPPAGGDASTGTWRWNGSAWTWYVAPSDPTFADPTASGATKYWTWALAQKGKDRPDWTDTYSPTNVLRMQKIWGNPLAGPAGQPLGFSMQFAYDKSARDYQTQLNSAVPPPATENPFGQELANTPRSYTPYGLNDRGMGGGSGGSPFTRYGPTYGTDNLVPSLEQRRMGMLQQMLNPQGGQ